MIIRRAKAFAPALTLLAALLAPPATADTDTAADCAILRKAASEYTRLANELSDLRKTADGQEDDPAALTATQRKIVALARTMGDKLHGLQVRLTDPALAYAYRVDESSFVTYADTLQGAIDNGDISATNIHVTRAHIRNVEAIEAANDAYHGRCG